MHSIQPGQNLPIPAKRIIVNIIGEPRDAFEPQTQAHAFLLAASGRAEGHADFLTESNVQSPDGAVVFEPGKQAFRIDLNSVASPIEKIAITLTIRSGLGRGITFGIFAAIKIQLSDESGTPLLEFPLPLASRGETALILAEIYRYKNQWKFRAIGQGFTAGLTALAKHFGLSIVEPETERRASPGAGQQGDSFSGTGFCVSPEGYFVTNHHVIENAVEIQARSPRHRYRLQHLFSDPLNDLALLKADTPPPTAATFRDGVQIRLGENIVVVGYPLGGLLGSSPQVTTGNVSSLIGVGDDTRTLQFTAPVQSGNSGGPLLDTDGSVVGVVCAKLDAARIHQMTGDIPQNVNFAIKSVLVRSFLEAVGIDYLSRATGTSRSPAEIATEAQGFVVRIECRG